LVPPFLRAFTRTDSTLRLMGRRTGSTA